MKVNHSDMEHIHSDMEVIHSDIIDVTQLMSLTQTSRSFIQTWKTITILHRHKSHSIRRESHGIHSFRHESYWFRRESHGIHSFRHESHSPRHESHQSQTWKSCVGRFWNQIETCEQEGRQARRSFLPRLRDKASRFLVGVFHKWSFSTSGWNRLAHAIL